MAARNLKNQNFADIAKSAAAKIEQLSQHPDAVAVAEQLDSAGAEGKLAE